MYQYTDFDRQFVRARAAQFRDQLDRHFAGQLDGDDFKALRLQNGWYIQRHAPMLRVAVPYGAISSSQIRALAEISRVHDRSYVHFTTRQNVQYNWIPLKQAADVMDKLAAVDMHGIQTSGNCIRNITTDALAGVAADVIVDPRPYCEVMRQWSTLEDEMRLRERKSIAESMGDVHYHPVWRDVETAVNSTKRLLSLARKTNRKIHVLHVSTAEEMDLLRDQKDIATVEVLPQHLTLYAPDCYDNLGTYAQQNPPIRDKRHMERIWKAVLDGTVDVIGSDHAPHTREEKDRTYPGSPSGVPGVQTLVPIMLNHVHEGRLSLKRFVEMVTENPCRVFGVKNKGRLRQGYDDDITIVDLKKKRTIENSWIASRCGCTPFHGMTLPGWMTHAIVCGQLVMESDRILTTAQGKPVDFKEAL